MESVQFKEIERLLEKLRYLEASRFVTDHMKDNPDPRVVAAIIMIGGGLTLLSDLMDRALN